jgi:hypothetical protein
MIEFTKSYKTADGQVFGTIEEAQLHAIGDIFEDPKNSQAPSLKGHGPEIATVILSNKGMLIDVLTTTPKSKPKARASHGGTKNRKKTIITDAATTVLGVNTPTSIQGVRV